MKDKERLASSRSIEEGSIKQWELLGARLLPCLAYAPRLSSPVGTLKMGDDQLVNLDHLQLPLKQKRDMALNVG